MRSRIVIVMLCLLAAAGLIGCERRDWRRANRINTIESYEQFLAKYPQSRFRETAEERIDIGSYDQAVNQNTISAYEKYLAAFPAGQFATNARNQRLTLIQFAVKALPDDRIAAARVHLETDKGNMILRLFPEQAPVTTRNFLTLALANFYDGLTFHRVEKNLLVQTGDPRGDSLGGPGYMIPFELSGLKHRRGAVAMWHSPVSVNTGGSQFYLCLQDLPDRDGLYTVFGEVSDGMSVADAIGRVETSGEKGYPPFQPLAPIRLARLWVEGLEVKK